VPTTAIAPIRGDSRDTTQVERPTDIDHAYRIVGKVRLLFFWVSAHDVGGARITWHGGERGRAISLLIGSEPERAPRRVNEWGYIREDSADETTTVFGMRTVTDGDSPTDADARRPREGELAELGILCSTISRIEARSRTATVHVKQDATYRDIVGVLDAVEGNADWNARRTARPSNAAPGFLTALDSMLRASATAAQEGERQPNCPRLAYIYKDALYDLIPQHVERIAQVRTHTGVLLRNVLSTEVSIRNRTTGGTSNFSIAYGTEGALAGIPIRATYQPNWWFKVELELHDSQDVPPDPARDALVSRRLAALCAGGATARTLNGGRQ